MLKFFLLGMVAHNSNLAFEKLRHKNGQFKATLEHNQVWGHLGLQDILSQKSETKVIYLTITT